MFGTSRGRVDEAAAVENLVRLGVDILFTVWGDGAQRGGNDLYQEARQRGHAVIVVAEGVGQEWLGNTGAERDASGNVKLGDIGTYLRGQVEAYFREESIPIVMRYFDPSYHLRSGPANSEDSILCDLFARNAVHAAMAGKTGLMIGFLHDPFIHVPIELLAGRKKSIDPAGPIWSGTLAATGQPALFQ